MRFIVRRSKEGALWFSGKSSQISSSPLPLQHVCLCLPLLIPIYYAGKKQESITGTDRIKKSEGIAREATAVSVHLQLLPCSSRWDLTWNTLTLRPPLTSHIWHPLRIPMEDRASEGTCSPIFQLLSQNRKKKEEEEEDRGYSMMVIFLTAINWSKLSEWCACIFLTKICFLFYSKQSDVFYLELTCSTSS